MKSWEYDLSSHSTIVQPSKNGKSIAMFMCVSFPQGGRMAKFYQKCPNFSSIVQLFEFMRRKGEVYPSMFSFFILGSLSWDIFLHKLDPLPNKFPSWSKGSRAKFLGENGKWGGGHAIP
jgi:hypothetical protein